MRTAAWVLVKDSPGGHGPLLYLSVDPIGVFEWNADHLHALRLARREDGDALATIVDDAESVQEHMWIDGSQSDGGVEHG
jgi:hypothetical protein